MHKVYIILRDSKAASGMNLIPHARNTKALLQDRSTLLTHNTSTLKNLFRLSLFSVSNHVHSSQLSRFPNQLHALKHFTLCLFLSSFPNLSFAAANIPLFGLRSSFSLCFQVPFLLNVFNNFQISPTYIAFSHSH